MTVTGGKKKKKIAAADPADSDSASGSDAGSSSVEDVHIVPDSEILLSVVNAVLQYIRYMNETSPPADAFLLQDPTTEAVILQIRLRRPSFSSADLMIPLPHPVLSAASCCLFAKSPTDRLAVTLTPLGLGQVAGVTESRKKLKEFADKRALLHSFEFFLADRAVAPFLPKMLGAKFFSASKHPFLLRSVNPTSVATALRSTLVRTSLSSMNVSVKVGNLGMSAAAIADNVRAVCTALFTPATEGGDELAHLKRTLAVNPEDVTSLALCGSTSHQGRANPPLPFWMCRDTADGLAGGEVAGAGALLGS